MEKRLGLTAHFLSYNPKRFSTFEEQVDLLERRGMATDENTIPVLMREGYYSVVNGYKDIFLDRAAMNDDSDDRFLEGSTFEMLYTLFDFDRSLREATFHELIRIETAARNAVVYAFCERHGEPDAYLDASCYCAKNEYHSPDLHAGDLKTLRRHLRNALKNPWNSASVGHYIAGYGYVPLWVLANTLTFGNISHFYALQTRSIQNEACKLISQGRAVTRIKPSRLRTVLAELVNFRNICAHDDRLFCARAGMRKSQSFATMLRAMQVVTDEKTMCGYLSSVSKLIDTFSSHPDIMDKVIGQMRVKRLDDGTICPIE